MMIQSKEVVPLEISNKLRPLRGQSGQALLEYILLLCIVTAIIASLAGQFFKPLGAYVDSYMGNYVGCLLEAGEMPSLGGDSATGLDDGDCNAKFEPGTLASGRPYRVGGAADPDVIAAQKKAAAAANARTQSSSGGGGYAGSAGGANSLNGKSRRGGNTDKAAGDPKVVEISIGTTEAGGFSKRSANASSVVGSSSSTQRPVMIFGISGEAQKKLEAEKKGPDRTVAGEMSSPAQKKFTLPIAKSKPKAETEEASLGFGDYLRFILIAAIIIILIALVGGQVAQLTKGWEK